MTNAKHTQFAWTNSKLVLKRLVTHIDVRFMLGMLSFVFHDANISYLEVVGGLCALNCLKMTLA